MSSPTDYQWMQFYNQISVEEEDHRVASSIAFSDAPAVTASTGAPAPVPASESMLCPISTSCSPKGYVSKPVRRRSSRASKKTPVTLLNANTKNFRALVQQFTGCRSTATFSFGSKKGPVNLNFGLANDQSYASNSVAANFGTNYCDNYQQYSHQVQPQQVCQEQQCLVSFDNIGNDASFATAGNYCNPNGFAMDHDTFHELSSDAFYSESSYDICLLQGAQGG